MVYKKLVNIEWLMLHESRYDFLLLLLLLLQPTQTKFKQQQKQQQEQKKRNNTVQVWKYHKREINCILVIDNIFIYAYMPHKYMLLLTEILRSVTNGS